MSMTLIFLKNALSQGTNTELKLEEKKDRIEWTVKDPAVAKKLQTYLEKYFEDCDSCYYGNPTKKADGSYLFAITKEAIKHKMAVKLERIFKNKFEKNNIDHIRFNYLFFKTDLVKTNTFKVPFFEACQKTKVEEILKSLHLKRSEKAPTLSQTQDKPTKKEFMSFRVVSKKGLQNDFITLLSGKSSGNLTSPKLTRVEVASPVHTPAVSYMVETKNEPTSPTRVIEPLTSPASLSQASLFHYSTQSADADSTKKDNTAQESKDVKKEDKPEKTDVIVKPSGCHCVIL